MRRLEEISKASLTETAQTGKLGLGGRMLAGMIGDLSSGRLTVVLPSGAIIEKIGDEAGPVARIVMHRWRDYRKDR